jgi:hypothetical protein
MLRSGFVVAASSALLRLPALLQDGASTAVPSNDTLKKIEFKILGWDSFDAGSISINEQFAFRVNQGWHSAWR